MSKPINKPEQQIPDRDHKFTKIWFNNPEDKQTALRLLKDLRDGACGTRAITAALTRILKRATII